MTSRLKECKPLIIYTSTLPIVMLYTSLINDFAKFNLLHANGNIAQMTNL